MTNNSCQSSLLQVAGQVSRKRNKRTLFCKHNFIFVLCTLLPGLPCEAIHDPPNGRMNCSGLVTNETCWFRCDDGYKLQGSEKRTCLNSSKWDGQYASCAGNRIRLIFLIVSYGKRRKQTIVYFLWNKRR